ncbi:MAG: AmmeMemoRadiSam system protein A, partial [Actinobacteria bacterium]
MHMTREAFGIIAPHPPIMVPAVGGADADVTAASADALAVASRMLERFAPDTLVVMSPHAPGASNAFAVETAAETSGSLRLFGAPGAALRFAGDPEFAAALLDELDEAGIPAVGRGDMPRLDSGTLDHGVIVPMSFLAPDAPCPVLVLALSGLALDAHEAFGRVVSAVAASLGRRVAFVASGDCSHRLTHDGPYPYSPHGAELDDAIRSAVAASDFAALSRLDPVMVEEGGECGLRSFVALGGFLGEVAEARVLAYEGPWGIGYLTAVAGTPGLLARLDPTPDAGAKGGAPGQPEGALPALARAAIEAHVRGGRPPVSLHLDDPSLPQRAGAFVSLHTHGELRGCIGTIGPTRATLAEEVAHNAIEAALSDPRFPPLEPSELADLDVKVDVLHEAEPCSFDDLDPRTYGVIVTSGWRRGLLLPDLEGVDTPRQQVDIAL